MVATIECIDRSRARVSCASRAPSPTIGRSVSAVGVDQVVLDPEDRDALAAQDPAPDHALRVGLRGLVEHRRGGGTPVDQQNVVVLVAQPDPADVPRLAADIGTHVEPAEDQALVGCVERGHPAGRLEDHGVALDQTALVADPPTGQALLGELLGRRCSLLQLVVDGVDVLLLLRDLARSHVIVQLPVPSVAPVLQGESNSLPASGVVEDGYPAVGAGSRPRTGPGLTPGRARTRPAG